MIFCYSAGVHEHSFGKILVSKYKNIMASFLAIILFIISIGIITCAILFPIYMHNKKLRPQKIKDIKQDIQPNNKDFFSRMRNIPTFFY